MQIILATIADAANTSTDGKLNLLGTYDTIPSYRVPVRAPAMVLAVSMRTEYEDNGRRFELQYELIDCDGKLLLQGGAAVVAGEIPPGQFAHFHLVQPLHQELIFQQFGRYRMNLEIDRQHQTDVVFQVIHVPE